MSSKAACQTTMLVIFRFFFSHKVREVILGAKLFRNALKVYIYNILTFKAG